MTWSLAANIADVVAVPIALGLFAWAEWRLVKERQEQGARDKSRQAVLVAGWMTTEVIADIDFVYFHVRNSSAEPVWDVWIDMPADLFETGTDTNPNTGQEIEWFSDHGDQDMDLIPPNTTKAVCLRDPMEGAFIGRMGAEPIAFEFTDTANQRWHRDAKGFLAPGGLPGREMPGAVPQNGSPGIPE